MGFGMSSAFGPIHMPTAERLANNGLRYNHFHTTALCSPTRAALLSGRNHHTNNMGGITEIATAFPGNKGQCPNNVAPLAEMLRLNGYSRAAFGKSHETAAWELSPSGPTDRWLTRSGFDKFYGFLGGGTNQWSPLIYDGLSQVELPKDPNYHFMTDMTNQASMADRGIRFAPSPKPRMDSPGRSSRASSRRARSSPPNRKPLRIGTNLSVPVSDVVETLADNFRLP